MSQYQLRKLMLEHGDFELALINHRSERNPLVLRFDAPLFLKRLRGAGKKTELVAKATKAGAGVNLVDCTAGLGRDGFLLAHLGCQVTLIERSRVLALLLDDALRRAALHPDLKSTVARITLRQGEAQELLVREDPPDVIYIDPMFPESGSSAQVKGDMQALQEFIGHDEDAAGLLMTALNLGVRRVVVKRPGRARSLKWSPPQKPVHVYTAKGSEFEVYQS